jgi:hypothetical protein
VLFYGIVRKQDKIIQGGVWIGLLVDPPKDVVEQRPEVGGDLVLGKWVGAAAVEAVTNSAVGGLSIRKTFDACARAVQRRSLIRRIKDV